MPSRTWYVSCSPRSPEKIRPELRELASLEGVFWRESDARGRLVHQIEFGNLLRGVDTFEGSISAQHPELSARDRFAPMQTYGLAFVDSSGRLRITEAGRRLIAGERVQELFLKQMLKWQYPSWQHGGNPRTSSRYLQASMMDVFPYVETLRACHDLGGLSKDEIGGFLLPVLNRRETPNAVQAIRDYRARLSRHRGIDRKTFARAALKDHYRQVYADDIAHGKISTRERPTTTVEQFLEKKVQNSVDVADAVIRYFRYTGLFTLSSDYHGLSVSRLRAREVERILDEMEFPLDESYLNVNAFYEHLGNPGQPVLPWEDRSELAARARKLGLGQRQVRGLSVPELKVAIELGESDQRSQRVRQYMVDVQAPAMVDDIVAMFDRILGRDVIDPPLFLEWNAWRALASMDDCTDARPNFTLDDDLLPFSIAPGNRPDVEVEYNGSFVMLVELTLAQGARQYDTEGEPVTRHIGRFQLQESSVGQRRDVFGLFVAPRIDPNTSHYFYLHIKHVANPDFGGFLKIIPLSIPEFIDLFRFCKALPIFNHGVLRDLLVRIIAAAHEASVAAEWAQRIPSVIEAWKHAWMAGA